MAEGLAVGAFGQGLGVLDLQSCAVAPGRVVSFGCPLPPSPTCILFRVFPNCAGCVRVFESFCVYDAVGPNFFSLSLSGSAEACSSGGCPSPEISGAVTIGTAMPACWSQPSASPWHTESSELGAGSAGRAVAPHHKLSHWHRTAELPRAWSEGDGVEDGHITPPSRMRSTLSPAWGTGQVCERLCRLHACHSGCRRYFLDWPQTRACSLFCICKFAVITSILPGISRDAHFWSCSLRQPRCEKAM